MNKIIFTTLILALITDTALAASTSNCVSCTDANTGRCNSYGSNCCVPCKTDLGDNTGGDSSFSPSECAENCPSFDWITLPKYPTFSVGIDKVYWEAKCMPSLSGQKSRCDFRCYTGEYGTITSAYTTDGKTSYMATNTCQQCPGTNITCQYSNNSGSSLTLNTCKTVFNHTGTSVAGTNSSITHCYIPSGEYGDSTGYFELSGNCYYKI